MQRRPDDLTIFGKEIGVFEREEVKLNALVLLRQEFLHGQRGRKAASGAMTQYALSAPRSCCAERAQSRKATVLPSAHGHHVAAHCGH